MDRSEFCEAICLVDMEEFNAEIGFCPELSQVGFEVLGCHGQLEFAALNLESNFPDGGNADVEFACFVEESFFRFWGERGGLVDGPKEYVGVQKELERRLAESPEKESSSPAVMGRSQPSV